MEPKHKPFDPDLSLAIDRAQAAKDEARERGDDLRERFAAAWLEKVSAEIYAEPET